MGLDLVGRYHRLVRTGWYLVYYLAARHMPISYRYGPFGLISKRIRALICRQLFAKAGKDINIEQGADFDSGWEVEIGDYSGIGINCSVPGNIKIGRNVIMGPEVFIFGRNHEISDTDTPMRLQGNTESPVVVIEDDVWIGSRAIILPGVRIGMGAVIGAGSIVTKNVPSMVVFAGNPAQVVRYRI